MIRNARSSDAAVVCAIYNWYVVNTIITFEEEPIAVSTMEARIAEITETLPWLVAEVEGQIVGYAYATKWRTRAAYRHSVETTVYLDKDRLKQGHGTRLYGELIRCLRTSGFHCAIGGIALPNVASVALHERHGFKKVAHFEHVGRKFGQWIDVGYWQLTL